MQIRMFGGLRRVLHQPFYMVDAGTLPLRYRWNRLRYDIMLQEIRGQKAELEQVCRHYGVRRLELFGSAVSGRYRPGESDLDFLVEFETLPRGTYADAYFGLLEALEDLFGRPVDLVVASAVKNPYFRESIESNKALLYAA